MDYWKALDELNVERERLTRAIAVLEGMDTAEPRRGRKSMPAAERKLVAERMRAYWAGRKNGRGGRSATAGG